MPSTESTREVALAASGSSGNKHGMPCCDVVSGGELRDQIPVESPCRAIGEFLEASGVPEGCLFVQSVGSTRVTIVVLSLQEDLQPIAEVEFQMLARFDKRLPASSHSVQAQGSEVIINDHGGPFSNSG
jgi:hypothetical protein